MEKANLTPVQEKLVNDLIKEFTKINPKPSANGKNRFSFDTIAECQREEERFIETIRKHNQTMIKLFEKQLNDEVKAFIKEFGKAFTIQMGYSYRGQTNLHHDLPTCIEKNKSYPQNNAKSYEVYLFIVSRTKAFNGDSSFDRCNGRNYHKIVVDFKREQVQVTLESGKVVYAYKICGLVFKNNEYLYEDREGTIKTPTLDEFIQTSKETQKKMVELAS